MDAHPAGTDDADMPVRRLAMIEFGGGLVADMDGCELFDRVEGEEAERRRQHHLVERAAQQLRGLGDQVEERGPDPDPGTDRDDDPDPADGAQCHEAAQEGRQERRRRDEERSHCHRTHFVAA